MLFRKKGWLRNEFDEQLLLQLERCKDEWVKQRKMIEKSVEPSEAVLYELKLAEMKYLLLLREVKKRKMNFRKDK